MFMPRYKLRTLLIVLAVAPVGISAIVTHLFFSTAGIADGEGTLTMRIVGERVSEIKELEAAVFYSRQAADYCVDHPLREAGWRPINLDDDGVAHLQLSHSYRLNWVGQVISYHRVPAIAVRAHLVDGSAVVLAQSIPQERTVHQFDVNLPAEPH